MLTDHPELPKHIQSYVQDFDQSLSEDEYASQRYAYRILFVAKTANRKGQADRVIEFVKSDSPLAQNVNAEYAVIKETDRAKFIPSQIVQQMKCRGFVKFSMHNHTNLWKSMDAKNPGKGLGVKVADKNWHWYQSWVDIVLEHCRKEKNDYT